VAPDETGEVEAFIARWQAEAEGERSWSQTFLNELCDLLGLPKPGPDTASGYRFEYPVTLTGRTGEDSTGWIDLYRKGCFVLESKQVRREAGGKLRAAEAQASLDLPGLVPAKDRGRRTVATQWDVRMNAARTQAEGYARALPAGHGWPPFVIVCDVAHCLDLYADFSGLGKYRQYPDRKSHRIYLEDLRRADIRATLRAVWTNPASLDPAAQSVTVTREVASRLAAVSKHLEEEGHNRTDVAMFLMRTIFTMFAEDVKLLPGKSFLAMLEACEKNPQRFPHDLQQLWQAMDTGGWAHAIAANVKRFNGALFRDCSVFALGGEEIGELIAAAKCDWKQVEPAILGTFFEQALSASERKQLGAHYTPRAYVERLVHATVMEPLAAEWVEVETAAERLRGEGDIAAARKLVEAFHDRLCKTTVLDPACGTGNFLYVSLELMKRLEGEVLEALANLGGQDRLAELEGHTVGPHQFLGIEVSPQAAAIAELVLWIGYLQWYFRTHSGQPPEPILRGFRSIEQRDAVLTWDGYPATTVENGREVRRNPRVPAWPEADYIVGNPPFIGGKDIRARLGDAYTEGLWAAHRHMNDSADFVMYWWNQAADILTRKGSRLKRFGLVTTNSITQTFQRRSVERHLAAKHPVSILYAIPDHPWTKATKDAAAVRIAMTVVTAGDHEGRLLEVTNERSLETDTPTITLTETEGRINADLSTGANLDSVSSLTANDGLSSRGVVLHGAGFIVKPKEAEHLGLGRRPGLEAHIRPYRNGRDLTARPRNVMVIDLFGLSAHEVRNRFPEVYQHVTLTVKPERDRNRRQYRREGWWLFGENVPAFRRALTELPRYIATVETAKHRAFQFLDATILPDNMLVNIASADAFHLGVLSSRLHVAWALARGGTLEDRPRYNKSLCFDPFPFPDPPLAVRQRIALLAERLDASRKDVLARHGDLTLTGLYNVLEKLKAGLTLTPEDVDVRDRGLVVNLAETHRDIDAAVAQAYGWPADLAEEEMLARLVALNAERAREEREGVVRWLRPEYQIARFGSPRERAEQLEADLVAAVQPEQKPSFPADPVGQTAAVLQALWRAEGPVRAGDLALTFRQGRKTQDKVERTLAALARLGHAERRGEGYTAR
jgi:hypothetical protein